MSRDPLDRVEDRVRHLIAHSRKREAEAVDNLDRSIRHHTAETLEDVLRIIAEERENAA